MITFKKGGKRKLTKNFSEHEFDCSCHLDHMTIIDGLLVQKEQMIREHFGKPTRNNSAHRCEFWNERVDGSKLSEHKKGKALDIVVEGVSPILVALYAASIGLRVGFYKNFTHIDTSGRPHFIGKY